MQRIAKTGIHYEQIQLVERIKNELKKREMSGIPISPNLNYYYRIVLHNMQDLEHFGRADRPFYMQDNYDPKLVMVESLDGLIHIKDYDFRVLRATLEAIGLLETLGNFTAASALNSEVARQLSRLYAPECQPGSPEMQHLIQYFIEKQCGDSKNLMNGAGRGFLLTELNPQNHAVMNSNDNRNEYKLRSQQQADQYFEAFKERQGI